MRTIVLASMLVILLVPAAFSADVSYSTLVPKTAKSMAMGGVFTAVPSSEFSFFGNPAFFDSNRRSYTLPSLDIWGYGRPSVRDIGTFGSILGAAGGGGNFLSKAYEYMSKDEGSGGGASAGLSLTGRGVGLGFFLTTDNRIEGSDAAGRTVSADTEATGILGVGFPIQLGSARLSLGGDLRPFYRIRLRDMSGGDPALEDILEGNTEKLYADSFFGAAVDLGASLGFGPFTVGMSIRDIGPGFPISTEKLLKLQAMLSSGNTPDSSSTADQARLTPLAAAGISWAPKIAPGMIDPALYLELQDLVGVVKGWGDPGSVLDFLHAGAELRLFKLLALRGGVNRGRISAGAGLKLLFLDLNAAVFTEELGALPGDNSSSGLALEAAIRL
jgi:hypothetical protein